MERRRTVAPEEAGSIPVAPAKNMTPDEIRDKVSLHTGWVDGWRKLIDDLTEELITLEWNGDVHQIKEKFGGLRYYIGYGTAAIFDAIERAEDASYFICETCGETGKARGDLGWTLTLCDAHHQKRLEDKKRREAEHG